MKDLAIYYRCAQFYAHNAHNQVSGDEFFQDHEYLGELYVEYDKSYDTLIERMIGLGESPDLLGITVLAANSTKAKGDPVDCSACFTMLVEIERDICDIIKGLVPKATDGTQNLLQGLADESEQRQYKLGQRIK